MPFFIRSNALLDEATEVQNIPNWIPESYVSDDSMAAIKELRECYDSLATITNHGRFAAGENGRRVASIPMPVALMMMQMEPDIFSNPKKLERWVLNHPEYQITTRRRS